MPKKRKKQYYETGICRYCYRTYPIRKRVCIDCKSALIYVDTGIEDLLIYYWQHGVNTHFSCVGRHSFNRENITATDISQVKDSAPYLVFEVPKAAVNISFEIVNRDCQRHNLLFEQKVIEVWSDGSIRMTLRGHCTGSKVELNGEFIEIFSPNAEDFKNGCKDILHETVANVPSEQHQAVRRIAILKPLDDWVM